MAINKAKARKLKRRLAYVFFPVIFAIIGVILARFVFAAIFPTYRDYRTMAFGDPPAFTEQVEKKSFIAYDGKEKKRFNNVSVSIPAFCQQYAELLCDNLEIDAPVMWGDSNLILSSGAGTYMGSALPGYHSTILMSAHNSTYFKGLKNVKVGDVFELNTTYARFKYQVKETKVLKADASAVNFNSEKEQLVLYTCYPFAPLASVSEERLFVYCDKISGPVVYNWEVDL